MSNLVPPDLPEHLQFRPGGSSAALSDFDDREFLQDLKSLQDLSELDQRRALLHLYKQTSCLISENPQAPLNHKATVVSGLIALSKHIYDTLHKLDAQERVRILEEVTLKTLGNVSEELKLQFLDEYQKEIAQAEKLKKRGAYGK